MDLTFVPARGLESGHAQTIFAHLHRSRRRPPAVRRERWDTSDGDFVDVDHLDPQTPRSPQLLILHGLEGSSAASYVTELLAGCAARGWGALALNFRSCSGVPNRLVRSYHAGDTGDVLLAAERLRAQGRGPLFAVAFSLGANVLLRLGADTGEACPFDALAAVSAPFDLSRCADNLDLATRDLRRVYRHRFVRQMRAKSLAKAARHPGHLDVARVRRATTLREIDDAVTAPLAGFDGVADYYRRASAGSEAIAALRKPTLLISASDDPIVPGDLFPARAAHANPRVLPLCFDHGGHVAFVAGSLARPRYFAEDTTLAWLAALP